MDGLVLKHDDLFFFSGSDGQVDAPAGHGLYRRDTRYLSGLSLTARDGSLSAASIIAGDDQPVVMEQTATISAALPPVTIRRERLVTNAFWERMELHNPAEQRQQVSLELAVAADFTDIFAIRGYPPQPRGELQPPRTWHGPHGTVVEMGYAGLDGVDRKTEFRFAPMTSGVTLERLTLTGGHVLTCQIPFVAIVPPGGTVAIEVRIKAAAGGAGAADAAASTCGAAAETAATAARDLAASQTDWLPPPGISEPWAQPITQGLRDLRQLVLNLGHGPVPAAGVPWFATLFGRDSIIAALQLLPWRPEVAVATLRTLAACQGDAVRPERVEEPGKIVHEMRHGEMAALGQVPFGRYYGSVDSTPLFLMLLAETYAATGDLSLCRELWPAAEQALAWCRQYGDKDGDGFLEYTADTGGGLTNQGWKDSHDSISYHSGELVRHPVALCEVQGYYYAGLRGLAAVATAVAAAEPDATIARNWRDQAAALQTEAERLRERFAEQFWLPDKRFIAVALDGNKQPVNTVTSNAGHCLWTGILTVEHAAAVAARLLAPDMFGGWGVRTLSMEEHRYDPVSYHNGSVWPHDTAIAVLGLARYGFHAEAQRVADGLLAAAACFPFSRLPELFGGQARVAGQKPEQYEQACSPQAWAAGAPLMLWQAVHSRKGGMP